MPDDYIPVTDKLKATETDKTPLEDRFKVYETALDLRRGAERSAPMPKISIGTFETRLSFLRKGVWLWAVSHVEAYFAQQCNVLIPEAKVDGRPIQNVSEFITYVKNGPWDNDMRARVYTAQYTVFGDGNTFAKNLAHDLRKLLKIRFTGRKSNGKTAKRTTKGNCFATIITKAKSSIIVDRLHTATRRNFLEAIYCRKEKSPKDSSTTDGTTMASAPARSPDPASQDEGAISKSKKSLVPRIVTSMDVTVEQKGFRGRLSLCEGHKDLPTGPPAIVCHGDTASVNTPMTDSTTGTSIAGKSTGSKSNSSSSSSLAKQPIEQLLQAAGHSFEDWKQFMAWKSPQRVSEDSTIGMKDSADATTTTKIGKRKRAEATGSSTKKVSSFIFACARVHRHFFLPLYMQLP